MYSNVRRVRLLNADFDILSKKIQNLFPNEQQAFYYVPPKDLLKKYQKENYQIFIEINLMNVDKLDL